MTHLNTRVSVFGVVTLGFAALSALFCVFLALGAFGLGTYVVFAEGGSLIGGAAVGGIGLFAAIAGLLIAAVQGIAGLTIMRGRQLGLVLGFVFSALGILAAFGGNWLALAYGAFGMWALWTSKHQFK